MVMTRSRFATALIVSLLFGIASSVAAQNKSSPRRSYALSSWRNEGCRAKGRFQDREYCQSKVIDQILADGKSAIPTLISQIRDASLIKEPVYDFWPQIETGALAHFILSDLFLDDTWQHRTMPELFPDQACSADAPSWECWRRFRQKHTLKELQARWLEFWKVNQDRIYWDPKSRCFRLSATVNPSSK
jgi:hypothetical protein